MSGIGIGKTAGIQAFGFLTITCIWPWGCLPLPVQPMGDAGLIMLWKRTEAYIPVTFMFWTRGNWGYPPDTAAGTGANGTGGRFLESRAPPAGNVPGMPMGTPLPRRVQTGLVHGQKRSGRKLLLPVFPALFCLCRNQNPHHCIRGSSFASAERAVNGREKPTRSNSNVMRMTRKDRICRHTKRSAAACGLRFFAL